MDILRYKICEKCQTKYTDERNKECPVCPDKAKTIKPSQSKSHKTTAVSDCCQKGYFYIGNVPRRRVCLNCREECGIKIIHKE